MPSDDVDPSSHIGQTSEPEAEAKAKAEADPSSTLDPQPLSTASTSLRSLVQKSQQLFDETYFCPSSPICAVAPGRVNLIGEHTDYTEGFVLPMCIGYQTVAYGKGRIEDLPPWDDDDDDVGDDADDEGKREINQTDADDDDKGEDKPKSRPRSGSVASDAGKCCVVSTSQGSGSVVKFFARRDVKDGSSLMTPVEESEKKWANYVLGVVAQYLPDLPPGKTISFDLAVAGDVPLGSGLSSSASLEVAVATFLERLIDRECGAGTAYSSSEHVREIIEKAVVGSEEAIATAKKIERALRCQLAEHRFANSPCGIMDQFISSAGQTGCAMLIDCRSKTYDLAALGDGPDVPAIVVANSGVTHSIGGGEYPKRVQQCKEATKALQNHRWAITKLLVGDIEMLRDVTPAHVEAAKEGMSEVSYKRAIHVTTENKRTTDAKKALDSSDWASMGKLMNESHDSLRDDYEVSCDELDKLVELARDFDGVYGSRMTGGGFGGCTVTLVKRSKAEDLMDYLQEHYKEAVDIDCACFETNACAGAREIGL
mmetsp:Transcript_13049/g.37200  ORF Transcript_13049/g.37200 Transcript_13049/m.37200 type:complete len:541 (+) Transcript_13049:139-1761(+)